MNTVKYIGIIYYINIYMKVGNMSYTVYMQLYLVNSHKDINKLVDLWNLRTLDKLYVNNETKYPEEYINQVQLLSASFPEYILLIKWKGADQEDFKRLYVTQGLITEIYPKWPAIRDSVTGTVYED